MSAPVRIENLPAGIATLEDHEAHARGQLDAGTWAYFNGGCGHEHTLRANRRAWDAIELLPRVLRPLAGLDTGTDLLGKPLQHPILLAPVAFQRLAHPDGELASVQAAAAQGAGFVLSTQASVPLEAVAASVRGQADRGPLWFQLYVQPQRSATLDLVRRAEAAGYEALVLTVDAPVQAPRHAQLRAGFRLPPGMAANLPASTPPAGASLADLLRAAPTWDDVAWLRASTRLPLLLKGVVHPGDARLALGLGVDGLIVSNHGGRSLDGLPATARLLPALAEAVGTERPLLVDGGIRSGTDILKALALGARAVLVGRPLAWGLANAGAVGVAHVLRLLRDELAIAMALCGCRSIREIGPDLLAP